jgi:hypothetical protein
MMSDTKSDHDFFERLARQATFDAAPVVPSTLKSRIYTKLLERQVESGPLMSLTEVQGGLCVFERILAVAPLAESIKRMNPCSVCHARILAEHLKHAPIYWPNCPYTDFQNR